MRKHYLDNIKWIVQVLVVMYHIFFMYMSNNLNPQSVFGQITAKPFIFGDLFQYIVYPWFMTVLFIVSGITSKIYLDSHTTKEFVKSRTTKLLVPSTIGLLVFGFIQGYLNMALSEGAFESVKNVPVVIRYFIMCISGTGVLWFLQVLWVLSILLVIVRKIEKDRLWNICSKTNVIILVLMAVLFYGCGLILNTPVIPVYRFGLYGIAFFAGYFIFSHQEVIDRIKKFLPLLGVLALASGIVFCHLHFGESYSTAPVNRTVEFALCAYFMSVTVLGLGAKFLDFENGFTSWMSRRSFGIYVFHYMGISAVAVFVAGKFELPAAVIYILSTVAAFGGALLLNAIISRVPFFRWAVLGISKRKAKENVQR